MQCDVIFPCSPETVGHDLLMTEVRDWEQLGLGLGAEIRRVECPSRWRRVKQSWGYEMGCGAALCFLLGTANRMYGVLATELSARSYSLRRAFLHLSSTASPTDKFAEHERP